MAGHAAEQAHFTRRRGIQPLSYQSKVVFVDHALGSRNYWKPHRFGLKFSAQLWHGRQSGGKFISQLYGSQVEPSLRSMYISAYECTTYPLIYPSAHIHICLYTYLDAYVYIPLQMYTSSCAYKYTYVNIQIYIHIYMYSYIYIPISIYIYMHREREREVGPQNFAAVRASTEPD